MTFTRRTYRIAIRRSIRKENLLRADAEFFVVANTPWRQFVLRNQTARTARLKRRKRRERK